MAESEEQVGNKVAPAGTVYVCGACGKRSRDRYGFQKIDAGWDESCMMHAVLCDEKSLVVRDNRVRGATAVPE